jgi:hypothetical protein
LDIYKEELWDKYGFDSPEESKTLTEIAKKKYLRDIQNMIDSGTYKYILIDYVFVNKFWDIIVKLSKNNQNIEAKTLYLEPENIDDHKEVWENRSRDFAIRHPGHGATSYHNGVGTGYINCYEQKIFLDKLPTIGNILDIKVQFKPEYKLSKSMDEILQFLED